MTGDCLTDTINTVLKNYIENTNISITVMQSFDSDNYIIRLYTNNTLDRDFIGYTDDRGVFGAIKEIKYELLQSKLFEDVRSDLKHYEELKNMKFVLDSLDKLDIIKQSKPKLGIDKLSDL